MSDHNILQKAIDRAIANGWPGRLDHSDTGTWLVAGNLHTRIDGPMPKDVFYSHDFCKALWGDDGEGKLGQMANWKHHLANMVLSDDPISYLGSHL